MINAVQKGDVLTLLTATAYLSGELVLEGDIVGVCVADADGTSVVVAVEKVYEVASTGVIAQGASVYLDAAQGTVSTVNTDSYAGKAVAAAAGNLCKVKLG